MKDIYKEIHIIKLLRKEEERRKDVRDHIIKLLRIEKERRQYVRGSHHKTTKNRKRDVEEIGKIRKSKDNLEWKEKI